MPNTIEEVEPYDPFFDDCYYSPSELCKSYNVNDSSGKLWDAYFFNAETEEEKPIKGGSRGQYEQD